MEVMELLTAWCLSSLHKWDSWWQAFVLQTRVARAWTTTTMTTGWSPIRQYVPATPACLSISPLCVKLYLYEVPCVPRKAATLMLEWVDQARLSQPLILCVKGQRMMGQMVELMNKEGYSINQLLANVDWGKL